MEEIKIKPIGIVKNNVEEARIGNFTEEISEIVINKEFESALDGIEDYSHVIIVYWMDRIKDYLLKTVPQGNKKVPEVGILACRCPRRPNQIGITTVRLLERKENILMVKGLDILNGTPIIDVKPYWSQYDRVENERVPGWISKLKF